MAKHRSDHSPTGDADAELRSAVECLTDHVRVLTQAIDELCTELQWRNNNRPHEEASPPPPVLRSMPADPMAEDWRLNRVPEEKVVELRRQVSPAPAASVASDPGDVELRREVGDLRQILAAVVLLGWLGEEPELEQCCRWLSEWASREFDPKMLRELMPESIIADMSDGDDPPYQRQLFANDSPEGG